MAARIHTQSAPLRAWHWLAITLALCACAESAPRPSLSSVSPSEVSSAAESVIELHGSGFYATAQLQLGSSAAAKLNRTFHVKLGEVFETSDVERVDAETLRFRLPAGLRAGSYDVELIPPGGGSLRLLAALTLRGPSYVGGDAGPAADGGGLGPDAAPGGGSTLQLEDQAGGSGRPLDPQSARPAGEALTLYAVLRDASGAFVADVAVQWSVDGDPGADTGAVSSALRLPLEQLGDVSVNARYQGLTTSLGPIHVVPGHAVSIEIVPDTLSLRTSDAPVTFHAIGKDELGHATPDLGPLSWRIELGSFGDFDAASATLTPRALGSGLISVVSGYGPKKISHAIEVTAGTAVTLSIVPGTLSLSADDAPVQLAVSALDALGHVTTELGDLTWSVASGPIGNLSASGSFDPVYAGSGRVSVVSSYGASAQSGTYEVRPGHASNLSISPNTWSGNVGDPAQTFAVTATDADGNATTELGALTYAVASGPIGDVEPQGGVLTPRTAGDGTISATSSYGASAQTGAIHIGALSTAVNISAVRPIDVLWPTQSAARIEVDVRNDDTREVVLSGVALSFLWGSGNVDVSSDYLVTPDRANVDRVPAGSTRTLVFWVDVASTATRYGTINLNAYADVFLPSGYTFSRNLNASTNHRTFNIGVKVSLSAPVAPANRLCAGSSVGFSATYQNVSVLPGHAWSFSGGTPATSTSATPTVQYTTPGAFPYNVTVTDTFGYRDCALGQPIYVGTTSAAPDATYPTGPIVISSPSAGQSISLGSFPRSDLLVLSASVPVKQCDGSAVAASGHNTLTVFSDRGLIDPAADSDGTRNGIQLQLTALGALGSIPLRAPANALEGSTTVYLEYADANGLVTAAGDTTFRLTQDTLAPHVQSSYPASDCGSACLGKGEALLFGFSEPMSASSLSNTKVELLSSASCAASVQSDISGTTTRRYDAAARTLFVTPAAQAAQSYALRVTLPSSITDAASTPNALPALTRCVIVSGAGSSVAAAKPYVVSGGAAFSPDGDGQAESTSWQARAYADTIALRLSLGRGRSELRAVLVPVSGPGDYTLTWDGTDAGGRIADLGAYRYDVTAINRAGVASAAASGYVELQGAVRMVSVRRRY